MPSARAVCLVEREAFAVARLVEKMRLGLMAPAAVWGNARTFNGRRWRGCLDGIVGGIPCQPHSKAGKRLGGRDPRDLWPTFRRITVQCGAWWVLVENVGGMLSAGDDEIAGAERIRRDLQRLGFAVEGGLFSAVEVGARHERERLFILAVADALGGGHDGRPGEPVGQARRRAAAQWSGAGALFPPGPDDVDAWRAYLRRHPAHVPGLPRGHDGLAHQMDRRRLLGNGVVPLQAAYALRTLAHRLAARSAGAARLVRMMGLDVVGGGHGPRNGPDSLCADSSAFTLGDGDGR